LHNLEGEIVIMDCTIQDINFTFQIVQYERLNVYFGLYNLEYQ